MCYLCNYYYQYRFSYSFFIHLKLYTMKKNVGSIDRIIRLVAAFVIVGLLVSKTVAISSILGIVLTIVAIIFGGTALLSSCPLYSLVGLSTCPVDTTKA